jgi:hypothetical protein
VPGHEALGEILRTFELSGFPGWAENLQAAGAKQVDNAGGKRRLRADDGELDFLPDGEVG